MKRALLLVSILVATIGFASKAYSINSSVVAYRSILTERFAPPPDTPDVGVSSFIYPVDTVYINSSMYPIVRIKNYGNTMVDSFNVSFQIPPLLYNTETITIKLLPGDSLDYQFQSQMTVSFGIWDICAKTELQTDSNSANNEACVTIYNVSFQANNTAAGISKFSCNIYPNPFSEKSTISISSPVQSQASLSILSMDGRLIKQEEITIEIGENQFEINLENQDSGLYLYTLETDGQVFSGKLILQ